MNHSKNSLMATGSVLAAALALVLGNTLRDHVDLGRTPEQSPLRGLMASREAQSVPEGDYFYEISNLLKQEYVEPIKDEGKLASGAVRGMVMSLGDPKSLYMDKAEFAAFLRRRAGQYEGIGADLEIVLPGAPKATSGPELNMDGEMEEPDAATNGLRIPKLVVVNVVPGSPAEKAGVKPGDVVESVDKHWVLSGDLIQRFRKAQRDWLAKKITTADLNKLRSEVRKKVERNIMPLKAREKLTVGTSGNVQVTWIRGGVLRNTMMARSVTLAPAFSATGDVVRLPLVEGSAQRLKTAVQGKSSLTLDLTHNVNGDFGEMKRALAVLAPTGKYGAIVTQKSGKASALSVKDGNVAAPKVTVKVDGTTRGSAEILALALATRGAKLIGTTGGDRSVREIVQLPDGSGYTLLTGTYVAKNGGKA